MIDSFQYSALIQEIDAVHSLDQVKEIWQNEEFPSELLYSKRMLEMLEKIYPEASNNLRVAAQCQHMKRWMVARSLYSMDRRGYHQWRQAVMSHQLEVTKELLIKHNVSDRDVDDLIEMLKNQGVSGYLNSQIIEDTACLVFLKWYSESFAKKHDTEKVIDILRKTYRKISETGRNTIPNIDLPANVNLLLQQALQ